MNHRYKVSGRALIALALAVTFIAAIGALIAGSAAATTAARQPLDATAESDQGYLPAVQRAQPTLTPTVPAPTATPDALWLQQVNAFRQGSGLPPVTENASWSHGAWLHSRYMVMEDDVSHSEDPASPWYTTEGDLAGQNGNIAVSSSSRAPDLFAIELWMAGPFHAVAVVDPQLQQSGFGSFREATGLWQMGATLDVYRGLGPVPPGTTFPVLYPGADGTTWLTSHRYFEWPDPLASCPGYTRPTGPPVIIQLGDGSGTPAVTEHAFLEGETALEHCVFDETTYTHPTDGTQQSVGRQVLNTRDAVVLLPRHPLIEGHSYTASITADGITYRWNFTVVPRPAAAIQAAFPPAPAGAEAR
ncbi:MAG: CAP domain-containing protein [Candidatus Promineifilaceae bacterium]|nr:CAP domain-containing protein [Candidatus Promineifilaceae bacterium]